jgi:surface polysaccharide O-acyltransferase-like enzyme
MRCYNAAMPIPTVFVIIGATVVLTFVACFLIARRRWFGLGIFFAGYEFAIEGALFQHVWFFFSGAVICLIGGILYLFRRRS